MAKFVRTETIACQASLKQKRKIITINADGFSRVFFVLCNKSNLIISDRYNY